MDHIVNARGPPGRKGIFIAVLGELRALGSTGRKYKLELKEAVLGGCALEEGTKFDKFLEKLGRGVMPSYVSALR